MSQINSTTSSAPLRVAAPTQRVDSRGARLWIRIKRRVRRYTDRPMVRPLALAGPILVLVFALPLLRPLRHPT